jgi:hypothetical protein
MKPLTFATRPIATIVLLIFLLPNCKKNSSPQPGTSSISFNVINPGSDTTLFQSSAMTGSDVQGQLTIEAAQFTEQDTAVFTFTIPDTLGINIVYPIAYSDVHFSYYLPRVTGSDDAFTPVVANNQFSVTIVAWNKNTHMVAGTFGGGLIQYVQGTSLRFVSGKFTAFYKAN